MLPSCWKLLLCVLRDRNNCSGDRTHLLTPFPVAAYWKLGPFQNRCVKNRCFTRVQKEQRQLFWTNKNHQEAAPPQCSARPGSSKWRIIRLSDDSLSPFRQSWTAAIKRYTFRDTRLLAINHYTQKHNISANKIIFQIYIDADLKQNISVQTKGKWRLHILQQDQARKRGQAHFRPPSHANVSMKWDRKAVDSQEDLLVNAPIPNKGQSGFFSRIYINPFADVALSKTGSQLRPCACLSEGRCCTVGQSICGGGGGISLCCLKVFLLEIHSLFPGSCLQIDHQPRHKQTQDICNQCFCQSTAWASCILCRSAVNVCHGIFSQDKLRTGNKKSDVHRFYLQKGYFTW